MEANEDLQHLRQAAAACQACGLWKLATQTVFGEGPAPAPLMLVGEQPGDQEDRSGRPFVGPAGRILDAALMAAGVDREQIYITNAVKHFKWTPRGKRRIHATPNRAEVVACRPWLDQELAIVHPEVLVVMGATAAQDLLGPSFRLTQHRGEAIGYTGLAPSLLATVHPSMILRLRDRAAREEAKQQLISDFHEAARLLSGGAS